MKKRKKKKTKKTKTLPSPKDEAPTKDVKSSKLSPPEGEAPRLEPGKKLRPLQLWILTRPKNVTTAQRHEEWRKLDMKTKQQYSLDTKAQRGV